MKTLTLNNARKILGKDALNVSDEELEKDIETAELLKDLFFKNLKIQRKNTSINPPNVP
jgi:hypothetical protein